MQEIDRGRAEYLVNTYADLILRLSYTYMGNTYDAQDICQTVFLGVLTDGRTFTDTEHEKAFIIRTTVNACKDLLKSAWKRRVCSMEACTDMLTPEPQTGGLLEVVQTLPYKYREVIYLHYYEGYQVQEIAAMLKRPAVTISTQLRRGRQKLKLMLGGQDYETV